MNKRFALLIPTFLALLTTAEANAEKETAEAIFAGGCFWCMEPPYDELDGVHSTTSGYINGHIRNPSYKQVSRGISGHTEVVKVVYDPSKVSYEKLLDVFWVNIDPTVKNRQFCDRGSQYRTGIYYLNENQRELAELSLAPVKEKFGTVHTEIEAADTFWPAEGYHQNYYKKNPIRYKYYRTGCGRDQRLRELWGSEYNNR